MDKIRLFKRNAEILREIHEEVEKTEIEYDDVAGELIGLIRALRRYERLNPGECQYVTDTEEILVKAGMTLVLREALGRNKEEEKKKTLREITYLIELMESAIEAMSDKKGEMRNEN